MKTHYPSSDIPYIHYQLRPFIRITMINQTTSNTLMQNYTQNKQNVKHTPEIWQMDESCVKEKYNNNNTTKSNRCSDQLHLWENTRDFLCIWLHILQLSYQSFRVKKEDSLCLKLFSLSFIYLKAYATKICNENLSVCLSCHSASVCLVN